MTDIASKPEGKTINTGEWDAQTLALGFPSRFLLAFSWRRRQAHPWAKPDTARHSQKDNPANVAFWATQAARMKTETIRPALCHVAPHEGAGFLAGSLRVHTLACDVG
jgi:hypothetical protein